MTKARGRQRVQLTHTQRLELEALVGKTTIGAGLARRGRAVLLVASGQSISAVARQLTMQRRHVYKWLDRFRERGIAGLQDEKRPGRPPVSSP